MANELILNYQRSGRTVYATVQTLGGLYWNGITHVFEAKNPSNWEEYTNPLTEVFTFQYQGDFPQGPSPGTYNVVYYWQRGGIPDEAPDDLLVGEEVYWTGASLIYLAPRPSLEYMTEAIQEWQSLLAKIWPEVVTAPTNEEVVEDDGYDQVRGIYTGEHVELIPVDKIEPPYAIIAVADWRKGNWAQDKITWEPWVEFYWVNHCEGDPAEHRFKLTLLRKLLYPDDPTQMDPFTKSQVTDIEAFTTNRGMELNRALRRSRSPLLAGRLRAKILVEDSEPGR